MAGKARRVARVMEDAMATAARGTGGSRSRHRRNIATRLVIA